MKVPELSGFDTSTKMGSSGLHLAAIKAKGPKPYLGSIDVVSALVRHFIKGVCDRVADSNTGLMTGQQAAEQDMQMCLRLADIFLGKNSDYESMGQWNSGGGLPTFMLAQLSDVYQPATSDVMRDKIVADVLSWGVRFVYEAITAHANDPEEDLGLQDDLVNLANDLMHFLLGIPGKFESRIYL